MKELLLDITFIEKGKIIFIILFFIIICLILMITYKIDNLPKRPRVRRKTNEERNKNIDEYKEVIDNTKEFEKLKEESNDLFISDNNIEENNEDYNFLEDFNKKEEIEDDDIDIYEYDKSLYEDVPEDDIDIYEYDKSLYEDIPEEKEETAVTEEIIEKQEKEEPKINEITTLPEIDEDLDALKKQIFSENKIVDNTEKVMEEPKEDEIEGFTEEINNNIEEKFDDSEEIRDNIDNDEDDIKLKYDEPVEELDIGSFVDDEDLEDEKFLYENMFYEKEPDKKLTEDKNNKK